MDKEATDVPSAEVMARLSSRKDFLKMVGAAGLGTAGEPYARGCEGGTAAD